MQLVVVESPYRGDIDTHTAYARRAVKDCLERGEAPIASHLLLTQPGILDDEDVEQRNAGIAVGHEWIRQCKVIIAMYVDYGISGGMQKAIDFADSTHTHIEYRTIGRNPL